MWRKTTNAPEKNLTFPRRLAVDATYLAPGRMAGFKWLLRIVFFHVL